MNFNNQVGYENFGWKTDIHVVAYLQLVKVSSFLAWTCTTWSNTGTGNVSSTEIKNKPLERERTQWNIVNIEFFYLLDVPVILIIEYWGMSSNLYQVINL